MGFIVAVLFLYLAFRNTEFSLVWSHIKNMNIFYMLLSLTAMFILFIGKGLRWRAMLVPIMSIPFKRLFPAMMIGYFAHNILPFRMGDLMKCVYLKRKTGISQTSILGSVLAEKFFDGLSLLLVAIVTLIFDLQIRNTHTINVIHYLLILTVILLFLFYFFKRLPAPFKKFFRVLLFFTVRKKNYRKTRTHLKKFSHGFKSLGSKKPLLISLGFSMFIWFFDLLSIYFLFLSFHVEISQPLLKAMIPLLIINLGVIIPTGPGDTGAFHYFGKIAFLLILPMGTHSEALATILILMLHFFTILPGFVLGGYYMIKEHVKIDLKELDHAG